MAEATTRDLVLLALAGARPETDKAAELTVVELSDHLEMGTETMADRISLLTTVSELTEDGLVAERSGGGETRYTLTAIGRRRAASYYDSVVDRRIEVRNGTREEITLQEAGRFLPEPALVRALAQLTDEQVLYLEDEVTAGFVDRTEELDRLDTLVDDLNSDGGRAVFVTGEAGIGKTTLVEEFLSDRIDDGSITLMSGACRRAGAEPYHAIRSAIEPQLDDSPFDRPDVDLDDAQTFEGLRTSLFADVADAIVDCSGENQVVVWIDDLHEADEPTLELLEFLLGRIHEGPILLVATYRPDDLPAEELSGGVDQSPERPEQPAKRPDQPIERPNGLPVAIDDLPEPPPIERIELTSFERGDTRGLIEWLLGTRRVPASFVDLIHERTGGVPLFVKEVVTRLLDRGTVDPAHDVYPATLDDFERSGPIEEAISHRLTILDETATNILRGAALQGQPFDAMILQAVVDVPESEFRPYLAVLQDAGLFEPIETKRDHYRIPSGLIRETVVEEIPEDRRATYHDRIAQAMESTAGDDPERAGIVAFHHEAAGQTERAIEAWLQAADHAEGVYAQEQALLAYRRALALAREQGDGELVLDVIESIGSIEALLGNNQEATRSLEYVLSTTDDVARFCRVAQQLAAHQVTWCDFDDAIETIDRALEVAADGGQGDSRYVCRLLITKANALIERGRQPEEQEALLEKAQALAEHHDDPELLGLTLRARASRAWRQTPGAVDQETISTMERAIDLLEDAGDETTAVRSLKHLGAVYHFAGKIEAGLEYTEETLERLREMGHRKGALTANQNYACLLMEHHTYRDGDGERAMAEFDAVIEEGQALNDRPILAMITMNKTHLLWKGYHRGEQALDTAQEALERGQDIEAARVVMWASNFLARLTLYVDDDPERAREHAHRQLEIGRRAGRQMDTAVALIHLGEIDREVGDHRSAVGYLEEALGVATEHDMPAQELDARAELVRNHLPLGERELARKHVEAIEALLSDDSLDVPALLQSPVKTGVRRPRLAALRAQACLWRSDGDLEDAIRGFDAVRRLAFDVDNRRYEIECSYELAITLRLAGEHDQVDDLLAEAENRAVAADLHRFAKRCRDELAE